LSIELKHYLYATFGFLLVAAAWMMAALLSRIAGKPLFVFAKWSDYPITSWWITSISCLKARNGCW
jgi:hypothetical protein